MLTFVAGKQPEVTEHFRGLMIDRGAFDRMLAHEAAVERRRLPLRRDGAVDRHRRHGHDFGRRPFAAACPDRRRRPAIPASARQSAQSTAISSIPGKSRSRSCCRTTRPTSFSAPTIAAVMRGSFPKARSRMSASASPSSRENYSSPCSPRFVQSSRTSVASAREPLLSPEAPFRSAAACGQSDASGDTAVLLAGDAAGLTNPVTGAGIASAVQSGALAGHAAVALLAGRAPALDEYEEELGDIFDAALERALRRRRAVLARYADGGRPDARVLSDGWISSPHYWAA